MQTQIDFISYTFKHILLYNTVMIQQKVIFFSREGYENLEKEQLELKNTRKVAVEDLAKARAMGDLSENGYYKSARAKLSSVDRRIREVAYLVRYGKVKDKSAAEIIDIGSTVTINNGSFEKTYLIVGGYESNPSEGKLSHMSPLGKELMGKKKGEKVVIKTPSGSSSYFILSVS